MHCIGQNVKIMSVRPASIRPSGGDCGKDCDVIYGPLIECHLQLSKFAQTINVVFATRNKVASVLIILIKWLN